MEIFSVIKENWLTRDPHKMASQLTIVLCALLLGGGLLYFAGGTAASMMAASGQSVFTEHQWWRLWTTLFAHGDPAHLLSNALLFIPLAYFLSGYFGPFLFPLVGLFMGGLINWLVLKTLPPQTFLIGISGVVYWMGAAWLTLYLFVERRERLRRRLGKVLILSLALFFPQSFQPEVSYLSHLLGFVAGIGSALVYYAFVRQKFLEAEVLEWIVETDEIDGSLEGQPNAHGRFLGEDQYFAADFTRDIAQGTPLARNWRADAAVDCRMRSQCS